MAANILADPYKWLSRPTSYWSDEFTENPPSSWDGGAYVFARAEWDWGNSFLIRSADVVRDGDYLEGTIAAEGFSDSQVMLLAIVSDAGGAPIVDVIREYPLEGGAPNLPPTDLSSYAGQYVALGVAEYNPYWPEPDGGYSWADYLYGPYSVSVTPTEPGPGPDPEPKCFWTDLVGVSQVCGTPDPGPGPGPDPAPTAIPDPEWVGPSEQIFDGSQPNPWWSSVQEDRKLLLVGDTADRTGMLRLNADGTVDTSFSPPWEVYQCSTLLPMPDGKIVVGGRFGEMGGARYNGLARLLDSGEVDLSMPNLMINNDVSCLALLPDGRIAFGGWFAWVGGVARSRIAIIDADGELDTNFDPPAFDNTGSSGGTRVYIDKIIPQEDNKLIVIGGFTRVGGVERRGICRLNPDGSLDLAFAPVGDTYDPPIVRSADLVDDGGVIFAVDRPAPLVKVDGETGAVDPLFDAPSAAWHTVTTAPGTGLFVAAAWGGFMNNGTFIMRQDDGMPFEEFPGPVVTDAEGTPAEGVGVARDNVGGVYISGWRRSVYGVGGKGFEGAVRIILGGAP